jgi:membrane protease YdiL (CAAX protease family)
MPAPADRSGVYLRVGVYIFLYLAAIFVFARLILELGGYFLGVTVSQFAAAVSANWVALRIYGRGRLADLGLEWSGPAARNLALGLAGGMGSAALVLAPPVAVHLARFNPIPGAHMSWDMFLLIAGGIAAGSAGEEILFRGFGFQNLLRVWGPHTTVFTVGALFAAMHGGNPNSTWLGLLNTAGFGILFGYALLRSGGLWMPIGLHFGWNFTLPLFGVNVSGLTMRLTGFEMQWNTSPLWSGGDYGPEGSLLTSIVLLGLGLFVWKAPVEKQQPRWLAVE